MIVERKVYNALCGTCRKQTNWSDYLWWRSIPQPATEYNNKEDVYEELRRMGWVRGDGSINCDNCNAKSDRNRTYTIKEVYVHYVVCDKCGKEGQDFPRKGKRKRKELKAESYWRKEFAEKARIEFGWAMDNGGTMCHSCQENEVIFKKKMQGQLNEY